MSSTAPRRSPAASAAATSKAAPRCGQRHPLSRRPQLPPHPRLAQCDRAGLCREGIPRPRRTKSPPNLHLWPEARRLRCHQARAAPSRRHRTPESAVGSSIPSTPRRWSASARQSSRISSSVSKPLSSPTTAVLPVACSYPAQPAAQNAQLPLMPLELLGMGVAPRHHCRGLGNAEIGLPQPDRVLPRQSVEPLDGRAQQLGIGREGDGLRLHGVSTVTRLRSWPRNAPASCATRKLSASNGSSCRRAACANGSGPSARAGTRAERTLSPVKYWKYGSWMLPDSIQSSSSVTSRRPLTMPLMFAFFGRFSLIGALGPKSTYSCSTKLMARMAPAA